MKKSKIALLLLLPFLFLFSMTPIYAEEDVVEEEGGWNLMAGWENLIEWTNIITDTASENIQKLLAKMSYGATANLIAEAAPELTTTARALEESDLPIAYKKGFVGVVDNQLAMTFNSYPRVDVVAHLSNEWVPGYRETQSVYADGYADLTETGVDSLWSHTRNLAYLGFVVIMIGIGFMIMFRSKIGGQTLVTIGNSIPRVVVSLILVTFSFAIIGLIIDISGVLMGVIGGVLNLKEGVNPMNFFEMLKGIIGIQGATGFETAALFGAAKVVFSIITAIPGMGTAVNIFGNLTMLVLLGIVTFGVIKLWFVLVKAYLGLLVNTIVAPLAIMVGAFPGSQHVTMNMFKSALRNALVFPLAFGIVNLPYFVDPGQVSLNFPTTLNPQSNLDLNMGGLILAVTKVFAIYIAAQAPIFMKSIIPASAPKSGVDAAAAIKQGLTKMPLFGGLFKDKK